MPANQGNSLFKAFESVLQIRIRNIFDGSGSEPLAYFPHTSSLLPHPSSLIILRTFLSMFSVWTSGSASLVWAACCCCSLDMVEESQEASSHILLIIHAAAQQHPLKPTHIIINTTTFYNDRSVSWIRIRATLLIRIRIRILNTDPDIHNSHN